MADNTSIEWTDATWNPITGCSVHSPGCTNCYAMKLAGTRLKHTPSRKGLTQDSKTGPVWTGEVRFNEQWLTQPLRWKRPRRIFVCAHADLFHENVKQRWLLRIFAVMIVADWHTYQVLTKRSERMRKFMQWLCETEEGSNALGEAVEEIKADADLDFNLPPQNVWLGVSVEDQARADQRIPDLLATPAALRWLSCEPLLGPVDLNRIHEEFDGGLGHKWESALDGERFSIWADENEDPMIPGYPKLDWIVCGGESGPGARPMHPDWARSLRDQCRAADVPFHFKQWGEFRPRENEDFAFGGEAATVLPDGQVREWADGYPNARLVHPSMRPMVRLGKKRAGRLLDGALHDGFPA